MARNNPLKGKLIQLLQSLSTKEWKRLTEYVSSPFFNKNKRVIKLLGLLKKGHPSYTNLNKEKLFRQIFTDKPSYNDALLRALMTDLTKLVEDFMVYIHYEQEVYLQKQWLLKELLNRLLFDLFEKKMKTIYKWYDKQNANAPLFFFHQSQLRQLSYEYTTITNHRAVEHDLQKAINHLDHYFLAEKLRYAWIALNRQKVLATEYDLGYFFKDIKQLEQQVDFDKYPIIHIYYGLVLLLQNVDAEAQFQKLEKLLLQYDTLFSKEELRQFYGVLINYCNWQFINGEQAYVYKALALFKIMLQKGMLYRGNNVDISPHNFMNMVTVGLKAKDFEWVKQFIKEQQQYLQEKYRKVVPVHSLAAWHFAQKNYAAMLDELRTIQFSDFEFIDYTYYLDYRVLLSKTYYELKEWDLLLSNMEAFRIYLRNNKSFTANKKKAYNNFINILKKMINKQLGKKRTTTTLSQDIAQTTPLIEQAWLEEKSCELGVKSYEL